MAHPADYFADLSDEEMVAADRAETLERRIAHLEMAFRYAQLACAERRNQSNVVAFVAKGD